MSSTNKTALGLLQSCLLLAMFLGDGIATTPVIAQERRSEGKEKADENESDDTPSMSTEAWAKGFVKLHDKNKNNWLDGEELKNAGRRAESADFNHDKVITVEELIANATKGSSTTPRSKVTAAKPNESTDKPSDKRDGDRSDGDSKSMPTSKRVLTWTGGGKTGDDEKKARRTYRFTPASEKLPTGLPSWFKSQDKNGDGQVAMSEYSRSWSKSTVAKFRGYDLNDDGVITAKEAGEKK